MTSVSENVYIDNLDYRVNKYNNNRYHSTIKMKHVGVKSNKYIDFNKEIRNKHPKFKIGDIVRISKYKNKFAKGYTRNWSEDIFVIRKIKNTVWWHILLMILMEKKLLEVFTKNNRKKKNKKRLQLKKNNARKR